MDDDRRDEVTPQERAEERETLRGDDREGPGDPGAPVTRDDMEGDHPVGGSEREPRHSWGEHDDDDRDDAGEQRDERGRVSVRERPDGEDDDEYRWHTGLNRPTGAPDAIEFIDVHKAFGRNKILRGLNMAIPDGKISMILGPSGTG